jgi:hypothetical protein
MIVPPTARFRAQIAKTSRRIRGDWMPPQVAGGRWAQLARKKRIFSTPAGNVRAPEAVCGSFPKFAVDFNANQAFPAKPSKFAGLIQAVRSA